MKLLISLVLSFLLVHSDAVGINYGTLGDNLPSHSQVVELVKQLPAGVDSVKIFSYNTEIISAFANTGYKVAIAIPNQEVAGFALGSRASEWVKQIVLPYASTINLIMVGNELDLAGDLWNNLVAAMQQLKNALSENGLSEIIKVTTPITTNIVTVSYPPSAGQFDPKVYPVLDFLSSAGSPFTVTAYPYYSWRSNQADIPLDYALFRSNGVVVRDGSYGYSNLLDAMLDAVIAALERSGHGNLELVVGETGWPNGAADGGSIENAQQYNTELLKKTRNHDGTPGGTPRRPGWMRTYIFALFNENLKPGGVEQHWGLLYPNGSAIYGIPPA